MCPIIKIPVKQSLPTTTFTKDDDAVKSNTHNIAKSINKSLLNDRGMNIGKFTQKLKGKILHGEIRNLNGLFLKIKESHMVDLIGS